MSDAPHGIQAETRALIRAQVAAAGSSFYWAMRMLPEARRDAMFAVYAFCRVIDDIADSDEPADAKLAQLMVWRGEVEAIFGGTPRLPLAQVLATVAGEYRLRREDFHALIDGMEMDAREAIRAPSLVMLDQYCDRVASAVGRLSVRIFGADGAAADRVAFALGRALQLTNILRDLHEDAARGRLYLPRETLRAHGIIATDPATVLQHPLLFAVCEEVASVAEQRFGEAAAAMRQCPRRAMRPARVMGAVYRASLRRLQRRGWQKLAEPAPLSRPVKIWLALRYGVL